MIGKARKLGVLTGSSEDLGVACSDRTPTLALKRTGDDRCPAGLGPGADDLVDEVHKLIRQSNSDLLAHTIMVPVW